MSAVPKFVTTWGKFMNYWRKVRLQDNVKEAILEIL